MKFPWLYFPPSLVASAVALATLIVPSVTVTSNSTSSFHPGDLYDTTCFRVNVCGVLVTGVPVAVSVGVGVGVTGAGVTTSTFTSGVAIGVTTVSEVGFVQLASVTREAMSTRGSTIRVFMKNV